MSRRAHQLCRCDGDVPDPAPPDGDGVGGAVGLPQVHAEVVVGGGEQALALGVESDAPVMWGRRGDVCTSSPTNVMGGGGGGGGRKGEEK